MKQINNKAQVGILSFIFSYIIVFIVWVTWAHTQLTYWGEQAIINGELTGIKAFLLANLNIWTFIGFLLGLILIIYVGGKN